MGVPSIASPARPQSAAAISRPNVYRRVLLVFLSPLTIVVAITLNLPDIAKAEPSETKPGRVDIGGGRKMYLECRGTGSPTVVLISGTRGAHDDWTDLIDSKNPTGAKPGESAVFPQVSKFTHVCAYDRPGTSRNDNTLTDSTPVRQPTTAQQGVADLHALLTAAKEPGPYVLVGHSWGGLIARLFASTYPDEVSGLVLLDPASEFLKNSLTPAQWATYIKATKRLIEPNGLEAPDHARTLELLHGSPHVRSMPAIVLTSDKRFDFAAGGPETWAAWRTAQDRLSNVLNAKHVSDTNSGHVIQMEQPQLVVDAIEQVVKAIRSGSHQVVPNKKDTDLLPIAENSRIALEKALDEGFAKSGLPGVITGLWIPGTGSWIASRGLADLKTKASMTADLQAPIGSITKSFAVTIALQLVGENKLRLEDTIERWYPEIPEASAITIKMLLNHSSGFADISMLQLDLHCADPNRLVSPDELIAMGIKLPRAKFPPGKGFSLLEPEHNRSRPDFGKNYRGKLRCASQRTPAQSARTPPDKARYRRKTRSTLLPRLYRLLPEHAAHRHVGVAPVFFCCRCDRIDSVRSASVGRRAGRRFRANASTSPSKHRRRAWCRNPT